jgi:glyoxylase-like metal-dependent hydrolase (beta-lactamase superfamily II)
MFFWQYQLSCMSLFSYLIGDTSTGRAVVVDPQRDVSGYLEDALANGLAVERVIETHFHADSLSGHLELAEATGAVISYGTEARAEFPIEPLTHGQRIGLGEVVLEIRHTPGHTPESISVVVWEHASDPVPWAVLTGDALFVGDVGRPDLLTSVGFTAEQLARQLYRSLHEQLLSLPDETRVFPAHGAGSACGKSMSDAVSSTIGEQRRWNYALQPMSEDAFVQVVTQGQSVAPLYFAYTADSNRRLRDLLDDAEPPVRFGVEDLERCLRQDAIVIDGRPPEVFASGHLRRAINVGLDGRFAEYAGDVVRPGQPLVSPTRVGRPRPGCAWPALASTGCAVRSSTSNGSLPTAPTWRPKACGSRRGISPPGATRSRTYRSSTSATPASTNPASCPAPSVSRWPGCSTTFGISTPPHPPSCTAPPATDPRSRPRCCEPWASPRSPTSRAATTPGPPPASRPSPPRRSHEACDWAFEPEPVVRRSERGLGAGLSSGPKASCVSRRCER